MFFFCIWGQFCDVYFTFFFDFVTDRDDWWFEQKANSVVMMLANKLAKIPLNWLYNNTLIYSLPLTYFHYYRHALQGKFQPCLQVRILSRRFYRSCSFHAFCVFFLKKRSCSVGYLAFFRDMGWALVMSLWCNCLYFKLWNCIKWCEK